MGLTNESLWVYAFGATYDIEKMRKADREYLLVPYKTQGGPVGDSMAHDFGVERLHIEAVTVVQGDQIVQINAAGIEQALGPEGAKLSGRGAGICISLWSECGKRFLLQLQFHKGDVYSELSAGAISGADQKVLTELWRD